MFICAHPWFQKKPTEANEQQHEPKPAANALPLTTPERHRSGGTSPARSLRRLLKSQPWDDEMMAGRMLLIFYRDIDPTYNCTSLLRSGFLVHSKEFIASWKP